MKFKEGDIVMVADPTLDWINEANQEVVYGIIGVVESIDRFVNVRHISPSSMLNPKYFAPVRFRYYPEALELLERPEEESEETGNFEINGKKVNVELEIDHCINLKIDDCYVLMVSKEGEFLRPFSVSESTNLSLDELGRIKEY